MKHKNNNIIITSETQHAFFDALVERIRDTKVHIQSSESGNKSLTIFQPDDPDTPENITGLLETFTAPFCEHGESTTSYTDWQGATIDGRTKTPHTNPDKNTTGTMWHVGDEPYHGVADRIMHSFESNGKTSDIRQHHLNDKMRSINKAIQHYMPDDAFSDYLAFFMENLDRPLHREALNKSFMFMARQIPPMPKGGDPLDSAFKPPIPSELADVFLSDMGSNRPNDARDLIGSLHVRKDLSQHPDLVLTLAIFHAAHNAFVSQLDAAFDRAKESKTITEDEHDNAHFTVNSASFKQFDIFLLFSSMAPLVVHEYNKLSDDIADEATRKKQAKKPEGGGIQTCPAHQHLRASKNMQLLETTFDYVDQHLQNSTYLAQAQNAIDGALNPQINKY